MKLIDTAIDQKPTGEDESHCVGCRTAMWKERRNHHIMISKQQPKFTTIGFKCVITDSVLCHIAFHSHGID
jgi:hypothetical protein